MFISLNFQMMLKCHLQTYWFCKSVQTRKLSYDKGGVLMIIKGKLVEIFYLDNAAREPAFGIRTG